MAGAVRNCLHYNAVRTLESGYGISLRPLVLFAEKIYPDRAPMEAALAAITVIMFKLEGQLILRNPDFNMDDCLLLDKIDPFAGAAASLALFAVFYGVPERYIGFFAVKLLTVPGSFYQFRYAAFLGFPSEGFRSSDYFPMIPWIFMFLLGCFLWHIVRRLRAEELFRRGLRPLSFLGRHSLVIYLAHQPVLMGVCVLLFDVMGLR